MAHRDRRRSDSQPSLSGHCGHGPIFIAQRSVANHPNETLPIFECGLLTVYLSTRRNTVEKQFEIATSPLR